MCKRVWIGTFATLVLLGVAAFWASGAPASRLRSEHAQPTHLAINRTVSVNAEGNLFHDASCPDLHKPAQTMPASDAIAKGYAPCPHCMREALGN